MSKGSMPRPITDKKKFAENWDKIFKKNEKKKGKTLKEKRAKKKIKKINKINLINHFYDLVRRSTH